MTMRKIKKSDIVGKTVKSIKNTAVNVLEIKFSDNTSLELWAEVEGLFSHIFVDNVQSKKVG